MIADQQVAWNCNGNKHPKPKRANCKTSNECLVISFQYAWNYLAEKQYLASSLLG